MASGSSGEERDGAVRVRTRRRIGGNIHVLGGIFSRRHWQHLP